MSATAQSLLVRPRGNSSSTRNTPEARELVLLCNAANGPPLSLYAVSSPLLLDAVDTLPVSQGGNALTVTQSRFSVASRKVGGGSSLCGAGGTDFPPKSIRYSIQSTSLSLSLSGLRPTSLFHLLVPFLFLYRCFLCIAYSPPVLPRTLSPRDYLAGCRSRMQRYTPATRCIDDDSVSHQLVRPRTFVADSLE